MQNLPPPYPKRNSGWLLPFKAQILMLRSKGYPFYQIAEILQPEAQKQGRKVSASIISYWVSTWRQQEKKSDFPKSVAVQPKPQTVTAPLGQYGYNPLFADWLVAECQNLNGYGDFDDDGAYFIRIDDVMDAYRKHPEIVKNGWDCREIPAILERWAANRMAWDMVFLQYGDNAPQPRENS